MVDKLQLFVVQWTGRDQLLIGRAAALWNAITDCILIWNLTREQCDCLRCWNDPFDKRFGNSQVVGTTDKKLTIGNSPPAMLRRRRSAEDFTVNMFARVDSVVN